MKTDLDILTALAEALATALASKLQTAPQTPQTPQTTQVIEVALADLDTTPKPKARKTARKPAKPVVTLSRLDSLPTKYSQQLANRRDLLEQVDWPLDELKRAMRLSRPQILFALENRLLPSATPRYVPESYIARARRKH